MSASTLGKQRRGWDTELSRTHHGKRIALVNLPDKQPKKRRRGRTPKASKPDDSLRRSQRLKETSQQLEIPLHENLLVTLPSAIVVENSDSAVSRNLKLSPKCLHSVCSNVYKHFKIVARARSKCQLDVLEAIYISRKQPELCIQKEYVRKLYLL